MVVSMAKILDVRKKQLISGVEVSAIGSIIIGGDNYVSEAGI